MGVRRHDADRVLDELGEIDAQSVMGVVGQHDGQAQRVLFPRLGGHEVGVRQAQLGQVDVEAASSRRLVR